MVGAPQHGPRVSGAVYFFTKIASGWHQTAEMLGAGPPSCCFGGVVAMSESTAIAVGAGVHVFTRSAADWQQTTALKGSDTATNDGFGNSVAITG
jgi:hypothetical protein